MAPPVYIRNMCFAFVIRLSNTQQTVIHRPSPGTGSNRNELLDADYIKVLCSGLMCAPNFLLSFDVVSVLVFFRGEGDKWISLMLLQLLLSRLENKTKKYDEVDGLRSDPSEE